MMRPATADELDRLSALAFRSKASWGYSSGFMNDCRVELTVRVEQLEGTFVKQDTDANAIGFYTHAACFYEQVGAVRIGDRKSASVAGRMLPLYRLELPGEAGNQWARSLKTRNR
jgi:hypothetical protein